MKQLAKISKASLEMQKHGILNFWIRVNYEEGFSQGVGGICLDTYSKEKKRRIGTACGCEMIRQLLVELKVNDFYEMKGRYIWVLGEGEGLSFTPTGIQALKGDGGSDEGIVFAEIVSEFEKTNAELTCERSAA